MEKVKSMDSDQLEQVASGHLCIQTRQHVCELQERGITILAKNAAVNYKGIKAGSATSAWRLECVYVDSSVGVLHSDQHRGYAGPRRLRR